jgi:hypothetical protein
MKPSAYISDGGILFKESPPDSILKLSPLYTSAEIQALHNLVKEQEIKIINLAFDLEYARRTDEWLKETDEQVIANAEKRFPFLKMRELTDEEILEVWKEHYGDVNISNFARAILRKASEKCVKKL